jgi:hypothetical protein
MYARERVLFAAIDPRNAPRPVYQGLTSHPFLPSPLIPLLPLYSFSMASSLPPNGLSSTNAIRAHGQANDIVQNDASRGNVAVHSFDPDASPAEKAAAAGKAGKELTSTLPAKPTEGGRGQPFLYVLPTSCRVGSLPL